MAVFTLGTDQHATIGQRVKKQRKDRGMSQMELAEGICSSSTVSLLETDQHVPSADILQKIAEKLGVPIQEIVQGSERDLNIALQLDIIEILVEAEQFEEALPLIHELEQQEGIVEYQRRNLVLLHAECLMRTSHADAAVEMLTALQQQLEQQREPDERLMATVYNKLGSAYYFASKMVYAHANYLRAYQISLRFPVYDLLSACISFNLAFMCRWFGLYEEAILHYKWAHNFFEKLSDKKSIAQVLMNLGLTYRDIGEFELSKNFLHESLSIYQAENMLTMARRVRQQYAFYILGGERPQSAIDEMIECAKEYKSAGDTVRQAYTYATIAKTYLDHKELEDARKYLEEAVSLFTEEMAMCEPKLTYVYHVYATYFLSKGDYEESISFAHQASENFCKMGLEKDTAESLKVAIHAYRKQESKDQLLETLDKLTDVLCRAGDNENSNWMEELR